MKKRPSWQLEGEEPDYRFSLANERTFLAWIRTALALLAGGVLLDQFASKIGPSATMVSIAAGLACVATLLSGLAYLRWKANEKAMRHGEPLPASRTIPFLAAALLLISATLTVVSLGRPA